ncbi:ubiquitin-specific protease [Dionaea muscipula]
MLVVGDLGFQFAFLLWFVIFPAIGFVIRRKWRIAVARREEIRRLLALASEETARAELEATGYGYGGFPTGLASVSAYSQSQAPSSHCVVCFTPTTNRCARCKAVRYCSGKCQIIHWRQGHKDKCVPPVNSLQNDGPFHASRDAVKQKSSGDDATHLESEEKQYGNLGVRSSDKDPESNHSTQDEPSFGDKHFQEKSDSKEGSLRKLDTFDEQNPSSLPEKLKTSFPTKVMVQRKLLTPESTTVGQTVGNPDTSVGDSDSRAAMNSCSGASSLNKLASSSHLNSSETQNTAQTDGVKSNYDKASNGDESESSALLRFSFGFSRNPSSELHFQGSKGLFPYELFVKLYNWNKVELQPCGLINCGNSCYANVVLQCLAFTPPLTAYFLQGFHSRGCTKKGWCFTCELESFMLKAKEGSSAVSPIGILSQVQKIGSHLANGREEDAHEFLRCAVDSMQSICLHEAGVSPSTAGGRKPSSYEEETNLIGLTFGGYLRSKIRCMRCRGKSQHDERIMDLSVEIDGEIETLEEALKRFTGTEILDGENKYQCGRCQSYEMAKKKLIIVEAPNILSITLKRYRSGNFGKLNKSIKFPEILNFAPYMGEASDKSPIYRLYGVVVHLDNMNSTFSGHYICYIRNVQRKWFAIDDSSVLPVTQERVLGRGAYMLFYSRCSPRAPRSVRDSIIGAMSRSKHLEDHPKASARIISSRRGAGLSQSVDFDIPHQNGSRFIVRPPNFAEVDSSSDSSSIFSHSDEASSSTSADSIRDSSSTDDLCDAIFGDNSRYGHNSGCRNFSDSDTSSSSSSSSPHYPKRSPLSNSKRYASSQSETNNAKDENTPPPALLVPREDGTTPYPYHPDERGGGEATFLPSSSSSLSARKLVYSSSCRETDSARLGWPNSLDKSSVHLRRSSSRRAD